MITREFLVQIGLNEDQVEILTETLERESKFRELLGQEHVTHIEAIMKHADLTDVNFDNEAVLREKIKVEYADFIVPKSRKNLGSINTI